MQTVAEFTPSGTHSSRDLPLREFGSGYYTFSFAAMGTGCQVDFSAGRRSLATEFCDEVIRWVTGFEQQFSRFIPGSLVSRINAAAGRDWVEADAEAESLFALCDWFHWATRGIFDPSMLPLIRLWDYHRPHPEPPSESAIRAARELVGWTRVQRRPGAIFLPSEAMSIDLGGIGKEYAVDRVVEMAVDRGLATVHVNFGHDLRVRGEPPQKGAWRIGLEDPNDPRRCWTGLAVQEGAVTTSGDYMRFFTAQGRHYGHILDPRSGCPVTNGCRAATVVAPTCTQAGILSTTAFILGPEEGLKLIASQPQAEGCLWREGTVHQTGGFDAYVVR